MGIAEFLLPIFHPLLGALVGPLAGDFRVRKFFIRPDAQKGLVLVVVIEGNEERESAEWVFISTLPEIRPCDLHKTAASGK